MVGKKDMKNNKLERKLKLYQSVESTFLKATRKLFARLNKKVISEGELEVLEGLMMQYATKADLKIYLDLKDEFLTVAKSDDAEKASVVVPIEKEEEEHGIRAVEHSKNFDDAEKASVADQAENLEDFKMTPDAPVKKKLNKRSFLKRWRK